MATIVGVPTSGAVDVSEASETKNGLMSSTDKRRLDTLTDDYIKSLGTTSTTIIDNQIETKVPEIADARIDSKVPGIVDARIASTMTPISTARVDEICKAAGVTSL